MDITSIKPFAVHAGESVGSICLTDQKAAGLRFCYHRLKRGAQTVFEACENRIRILFLCSGRAMFENSSKKLQMDGRGIFIGKPDADTRMVCREKTEILELVRYLTDQEWEAEKDHAGLPFAQEYDRAQRYLEEGKSDRTINRMLVPQRLVPGFAMGSVETSGEDCVARHRHPMVEQYFFSLAENDCFALIDNERVPYQGNTLLHIPLGSDHGILSEKGQTVHYLWIDLLSGEEGLKYMEEAHHMI